MEKISTSTQNIPNQNHNKEKKFPFKTNLSFKVLLGKLRKQVQEEDCSSTFLITEILKRIDQIPLFNQSSVPLESLEEHKETFHLLMNSILPPATYDTELTGIMIPFNMEPCYVTPSLEKVLFKTDENQKKTFRYPENFSLTEIARLKMISAFMEILQRIYGVKFSAKDSMVFTVKDDETGLAKHYQASFNTEFTEVKALKKPKQLTPKEIEYLKDNIFNIQLLSQYFPPEEYAFNGFIILNFIDITEQQVVSYLKDELLKKGALTSSSNFKLLERRLQELFQMPTLRLGLAAFDPDKTQVSNHAPKIWKSFISHHTTEISCEEKKGCVYEQMIRAKEAMVIEDLQNYPNKTQVEKILLNQGIASLLIAPMIYDGKVIGVLELGSSQPGKLDFHSMTKLETVIPLFSLAVKNGLEDITNEIEAIMQKEFTAIHSSVEWKFVEVASDFKAQKEHTQKPKMKPVVFEDVYPLYGQSDIRGSSIERNHCIQADLTIQLDLIDKVLHTVNKQKPFSILEELSYRIAKCKKEIQKGVNAGDELTILDFIKYEVEVLFDHFQTLGEEVQKAIQTYQNALDENLGIVYKHRKAFEESLTKINETVSFYLEGQQAIAQKMFPHYFEKYKTDGVEYNMYVGASLLQGQNFDLIYLKNLRLWQLQTMSEITRITEELKPTLPVPLSTTQLILVHSTPLSIRFRQDEKKFDVDGAYNIRYEIIKKRIDKAHIKGTQERLTQPGKIAIVYSRDKEVKQYIQYIEFLQHKNLLKSKVEYLELEELQGASGLKAIRVEVNLHKEEKKKNFQYLNRLTNKIKVVEH